MTEEPLTFKYHMAAIDCADARSQLFRHKHSVIASPRFGGDDQPLIWHVICGSMEDDNRAAFRELFPNWTGPRDTKPELFTTPYGTEF